LTCAFALGRSRALAAAPFQLPSWSVSGTVDTAFGYNDNVLLGHSGEERSAFARSRAELFVFNLPEGRFDYSMLGEVTGTRYFSRIVADDQKVDHEAGAWLNVEPGYRLGERLKVSLPLVGYFRDEVLDVSDTEVQRRVAAWKVWGGNVAPTLRWTFHRAWWLEATAMADRRKYDDHSNDSRLGLGELRLNWRPTERIDTRLSATRRWRDFDTRAQYNAAGREIIGSDLKIAEREAELRVDLTWDKAERWKTSSRASVLDYRDNGAGFFDYREKTLSQELEWKTRNWLTRIEGSAGRLDFDVQTVGLGFLPPPLVKDHFTAKLRLERTLSSRWTVFGGYAWERRRSNEPIESYAVNEGLLGLRWSWVK
jgi:hypothetical protein